MIKQYHLKFKLENNFQRQKERLDLQIDERSLYVCHESIERDYPIFTPVCVSWKNQGALHNIYTKIYHSKQKSWLKWLTVKPCTV